MLKIQRFAFTLASLAFLAVSSHAYVVIDNFAAKDHAFSSAVTGGDVNKSKATGVVSDDQSGEITTQKNFSFNSTQSGAARGNNTGDRNRSQRDLLLRYMSASSSASQSSGGGGGGGGGGGRRGRRPSQQDLGDAGYAPVLLISIDPTTDSGFSVRAGQNGSGVNVSLPLLDNGRVSDGPTVAGENANPGPGPSSSDPDPNNPDGGSGDNPDSGDNPGSIVSGTPEPAALVVWAIAACCGYGVHRCRQKWSPQV